MSVEARTGELDKPRALQRDEPRRRWRLGLRQMLVLVFYCALVCWVFVLVVNPALALLVVLLATLVIGLAVGLGGRRSNQQQMLLGVMAIALERGMPLAPALLAFADQFGGRYRRKIQAVAMYLEEGVNLPEALDRVPRVLPADSDLLVRVGWSSGTLARAVRQAATLRRDSESPWSGIASHVGYFLFTLYLIQGNFGFLCLMVIPRYQTVLKDFAVKAPPVTLGLLQLSDFVTRHPGRIALLAFVELGLLTALVPTSLGWSRFHVPLVDRLFLRRHAALILRSLAWVIEGGEPLGTGFGELARWYPAAWIRRRLQKVCLDVQHGTGWIESLVYHGLLRPSEAALLESAQRVGNLPWALRETAESSERRLAYRMRAFGQALLPVFVLLLGLLVGSFVIAFFLPLVGLLEVMAR